MRTRLHALRNRHDRGWDPVPSGQVSFYADKNWYAGGLEHYRTQLLGLNILMGTCVPAGITRQGRLLAWSWARAFRAKRWFAW